MVRLLSVWSLEWPVSILLVSSTIFFSLNFLDKTLNLLKNGMKTFSDKMNETSEMDSIEQLSSDPPTCKLKSSSNLKKQMLLTDKLQLTTSDKTINVRFPRNYRNLSCSMKSFEIFILI